MDKIRVAKLLIAKADSTPFVLEELALRAKAAEFLAAAPAPASDCDHNFCWDCCCHGDCRDCGMQDPDFDPSSCTYC
jgi:hypothetical protein